MLRFLTAGESHGQGLTGIIEGLPAGVSIDAGKIDFDLYRRQQGYGRGERMKIEKDRIEILSRLVEGKTIGAPIALWIENKDWENWKNKPKEKKTVPRPGHADLAGLLKYGLDDIQSVIERASARETAMRVAIGSVAKQFLANFEIELAGHVIEIGGVSLSTNNYRKFSVQEIRKRALESPVFCIDEKVSKNMCQKIDEAKAGKDTVGGIFEVIVSGVPIGLGSYAQGDRRLDAMLAQAVMSIPSVKAVEIGDGIENAGKFGSDVHDEIHYSSKKGYYRLTNRAGGTEAGVSNGEDIVVRGYAKPISTLLDPLNSVDTITKKKVKAPYVRSDICFVPALSVVGEAVAAWVVAGAFMEKFGGDSLSEVKRNFSGYLKTLR
jgi:chorismate synthase